MLKTKSKINIKEHNFEVEYNRLYITINDGIVYNRTNNKRYLKLHYIGDKELVYRLKDECVCWNTTLEKRVYATINEYSMFKNAITIEINPKTQVDLNVLLIIQTFYKEENILFVGDKFTYDSVKHMFNVTNVNRRNIGYIKSVIKAGIKFEMLFIESFWIGHSGSWYHLDEGIKEDLEKLVNICRENSIKIIFYNKEDPFHYNDFLWIAKLSDHILTIDEDCISRYKKEFPNKKVDYFGFIIDERVFNYSKSKNAEEKIFYSASYYSNRFDERKQFFHKFLEYVEKEEFSFEIIDRYFQKNAEVLKFPKSCDKYIKTGHLSAEELVAYTSNYKYSLNINSVSNSKSFMARRVLEHIALGKIVISNYSLSYENFNNKLLVYSKENNIEEIFEKLNNLDVTNEEITNSSMDVLCEYGTIASKNKFKHLGIINNNNIMSKDDILNDVINIINKGGNK